MVSLQGQADAAVVTNLPRHHGSGRFQQRIPDVGLCLGMSPGRGWGAVHEHQRVGQHRLLKAAHHQLVFAQGQLPVNFFQGVSGLIATHIRGGVDVLGGLVHNFRSRVPRGELQLVHLKGHGQYQHFPGTYIRLPGNGKQPEKILDYIAVHARRGDTHVHGVEGQRHRLPPAAQVGHAQLGLRGIRRGGKFQQDGRNGQRTTALHLNGQGNRVPRRTLCPLSRQ